MSQNRWLLKNDPEAQDEAQKYASPVPSRKFITQLLTSLKRPTSRDEMVGIFDITDPDAKEAFRRRLKAMERDGQLLRTRKGEYGLVRKMDLIKGVISAHRDGFGFLVTADGEDDLYLSSRQMRAVFDGDVALASIRGVDRRGRKEGAIVEVIERNTDRIVGRYDEEFGIGFVEPDNPRFNQQILISPDDAMQVTVGQYVVVDITVQPTNRSQPKGCIVEVLGDMTESGMEIDVAIRAHDIPFEWSPEVQLQLKQFDAEVAEEDKKKRYDLRELPLVTIDGEDARDFDDAVFCERKKNGGWRLIVAIADVSHYVELNSALDQEARNRGNSVYFPSSVVPMLPEALSNHLCSLNPHVDRLCLGCEISVSASGRMSRFKFFEGVMCSAARLTYTDVGEYIDSVLTSDSDESDTGETALEARYPQLVEQISDLYELYQVLREAREVRGAIDFDTVETSIKFGQNGKIETIKPLVRNEAHKLIEECMLCANTAAAKTLQKNELEGLYRNHDGPNPEKLQNLKLFLKELGLSLQDRKKLQTKDFQYLLKKIEDRPDRHLIQTVLLRSMSPAVYAPENSGHFGLGYTEYLHFTSPIRRYPDLIVHRSLRYMIRSMPDSPNVISVPGVRRVAKKRWMPHNEKGLVELGDHFSMTERRADEATRDAVMRLKCEYMKSRVGEQFSGVISSVTSFGLFVELSDVYVEGLVHISSLESDYYHFDAIQHRLRGERTGRVFCLADHVIIRVQSVDLDERKIDLTLVESETREKSKPKSEKRRKRKRSGRKSNKGRRR